MVGAAPANGDGKMQVPFRQVPTPRTPKAGVHRVPSACFLTVILGSTSRSKHTYWHGFKNRILGKTREQFGGAATRSHRCAGAAVTTTATNAMKRWLFLDAHIAYSLLSVEYLTLSVRNSIRAPRTRKTWKLPGAHPLCRKRSVLVVLKGWPINERKEPHARVNDATHYTW